MQLSFDIGELKQNELKPFWTNGGLSLHNMLERILYITGPADVSIASFSVSEESLVSLFDLCETGRIRKFRCLFDKRTIKDKTALLFFASDFVQEVYITETHAKLVVVSNENWKVSIIGSANLTNNTRYECGAISTIPNDAEFYLNHFEAAILNAVPINTNE